SGCLSCFALLRTSPVIFFHLRHLLVALFFFFNATATTAIHPLSLHDALPIYLRRELVRRRAARFAEAAEPVHAPAADERLMERRSEEHTSELQSRRDLVCRLLLEKKKNK